MDYAAIAEAAGIKHIRIEDPKKARKQIREAMDFDGPVLVDMITDPNALSIPPTLTFEQLLGFSKAATRTVFGGGVGQMLQLAQSNLRNIPRP